MKLQSGDVVQEMLSEATSPKAVTRKWVRFQCWVNYPFKPLHCTTAGPPGHMQTSCLDCLDVFD